MPCFVYILFSEALGKHYIGCSKFRGKRLRQHLAGQTHWTSQADDWEEVFHYATSSRDEALHLEKKIKKRGAKRFLATLEKHL